MRLMPDRDAARGRAQGYVNEAQDFAFPTAQPIVTAPKEPERPLLLYCPEQAGWQTGKWVEERGRWVSTAAQQLCLEPTHWMEAPPELQG